MTTKEKFLDLLKDEILNLINNVFNYTSKNPLSLISDLSNEFTLKSLILEVEPNIESTCGFMDLTKDNKFGIRYANFVEITKCANNFIDHNSERFRDKGFFKSHIVINDIINNNQQQLILLGKMLIILFTIAPNNDSFLGKINTLETSSQEIYINIIEEFLKSDNSFNTSRFSEMNNSVFQTKNSFHYKYEDFERENKKLKHQIGDLNTKISELSRENSKIDLKYKDCLRELEMTRTNNQVYNINAKDSLENNELRSKVECKDNELFEMKIKYDREVEKHNNEMNKFKVTIEKLNYELLEFKQMKKEYEDLKIKVKELAKYKELCADYNNLLTTIDNRNLQIETLNNEKRGYVSQNERLQKEIIIEKDKYRQLEYEKKKMEYDLNDMRADVSRMENHFKRKDTYTNLNNISEVRKDLTEALQDKFNFLDMDKDSIIFELDKNKDDRARNLEKELNELRTEKQEILKNYRSQVDDIHTITEEKNKLLQELDEIIKEREKLLIDKGKIEIQIEKLQLEIQKNNMNYNMTYNKLLEEKKILEDSKKDNEEKIDTFIKEKINLQKEIEVHKLQNHNLKLNYERVNLENKNLHTEIESTKHLNINTDASISSFAINTKNKKFSPKNNMTISYQDTDQSIQRNLMQKDEIIKLCKDKIKNLEFENKSLFAQITENQEKNKIEMQKKFEDFEFYRRSYEEQRNRVNREHELISSSLYELASQFMFLKKEMQKKINPENPSKN